MAKRQKAGHRADAQAFIRVMEEGGYRPNRYRIILTGDLAGVDSSFVQDGASSFSMLAVSSQVPQSTMGVCEAYYFGRPVKMAGDRSFEDWTCEVYTDSTFQTRNFLEIWHDKILGAETNIAAEEYRKPLNYYFDARVDLLDREDNVITTYHMKQIFPNNIGEIALSYETNNTIARFPVTFSVNYWYREDAEVPFQSLSSGGGLV